MQTFLPYPDFAESARVLDMRRLGKQRLEVKQLLAAIAPEDYPVSGWRKHPAAAMWRGHAPALAMYGVFICQEWRDRGYRDTMLDGFCEQYLPHADAIQFPSWLGDEAFHASHRSNLLRKDHNFYSRWGWTEPLDLPYIWPRPD